MNYNHRFREEAIVQKIHNVVDIGSEIISLTTLITCSQLNQSYWESCLC